MINKLTKYVKKTTKKASTFVNKVIHGRDDLSPSVKKLLKQYGDVPIIGITIFRHALASPLVSVINAVSGFQFKKNIKDAKYDELFHLGLKITLQGNTIFNLEKTEVISLTMNPASDSTDEFLPVSHVPENLTLNEMLINCKNKMGNNFYTYASSNNNCQYFALALLESNFMSDPIYTDFVKQDTESLFENTGILNSVANGVTDLAGRFNVIAQGGCNLASGGAGGNRHHGVQVELLHHRNLVDFNNNTKEIFNIMSVAGKYQIIGSSNISNLIYNSDYDLQEYDELKSTDKAYHIFKTKFKSAMMNPNIYITDFKCGENKNGEPLRWSYDDMMLGENQGITFKSAMLQK